MSREALARAGVTLAGRLVAAHGEQVAFDNSAPANIAAGDAFAARIRAMLDQAIRRAGLDAPPVEPDDADTPISTHRRPWTCALWRSVPWCGAPATPATSPGFLQLRDADGRPRHHGGGAPLPGVWYVGLRWLTHRASGNFLGFPTDAATTARAVAAHLKQGHSPASPAPSPIR
jgi:putative flavoprotein involved in K+ transport